MLYSVAGCMCGLSSISDNCCCWRTSLPPRVSLYSHSICTGRHRSQSGHVICPSSWKLNTLNLWVSCVRVSLQFLSEAFTDSWTMRKKSLYHTNVHFVQFVKESKLKFSTQHISKRWTLLSDLKSVNISQQLLFLFVIEKFHMLAADSVILFLNAIKIWRQVSSCNTHFFFLFFFLHSLLHELHYWQELYKNLTWPVHEWVQCSIKPGILLPRVSYSMKVLSPDHGSHFLCYTVYVLASHWEDWKLLLWHK